GPRPGAPFCGGTRRIRGSSPFIIIRLYLSLSAVFVSAGTDPAAPQVRAPIVSSRVTRRTSRQPRHPPAQHSVTDVGHHIDHRMRDDQRPQPAGALPIPPEDHAHHDVADSSAEPLVE